MIKRQELVSYILDLYDYVDHLEKENEKLKPYASTQNGDGETLSHIDYEMIDIGKQYILNHALYSWKEVNVKYNEESDTYIVTRYEKWLKEKINTSSIPDSISLDEFRTYFRKELQEMYEEEKTKALNEAKGIENVEEE